MTETLQTPGQETGAKPISRTKLIEVALPLAAINAASAREKSIRHGHPSTLHLWWSRKPLATCRAVLFAQLVDDPSACPEEFPTEEAQETERQRLFRIIEKLVKWESSTNEAVLLEARREIARSVARAAKIEWREERSESPEYIAGILREHAPPVLDPFCGGGSIPLEAQRLGLEAHASDLNPVAVLITKALIEIPPKFAGMPSINPAEREKTVEGGSWLRATGLANDVRHYGKWMRDEAFQRIGHLYPKVTLPPSPLTPHSSSLSSREATVIAWLWARTVTCPNPACGATMPLTSKWTLSTKKGKESWVEPVVDREAKTVRFEVRSGPGTPPEPPKIGRGARFRCLVCGNVADEGHIKAEAKAGRMGEQLMAVVAEGAGRRIYVAPSEEQEQAARDVPPAVGLPDQPLADDPRNIWCVGYGLDTFDKLFTPRQLLALTTFSDLVGEARERVLADARAAGMPEGRPLHEGGDGAVAYADAVATYLGLGIGRCADFWCTIATWSPQPKNELVTHAFGRQAIPMTWDFGEINPFSSSGGNFEGNLAYTVRALEATPATRPGAAIQREAVSRAPGRAAVSTDPPYYDNIGYADLSDFFYVWLRQSLRPFYPALFATLLVPKAQELVAAPHRFNGSKEGAERFFEEGLGKAFAAMRQEEDPAYALTLYYAFKQAESDETGGKSGPVASTGWETMLSGLLRAGFSISGTWPMRSERPQGLKTGTNALASSIVLVCRPRPADAPLATRSEFLAALRRELPPALHTLQRENIAATDLAQAAIGPGMRVFSRYSKVLEADGSLMPVRTALGLINQVLDEVTEEQEGEYDADTRWAIAWFKDFGVNEGPFGVAETLSKAKNTSVAGMVEAGILAARAGKVRLLRREEMDPGWDPSRDQRLTLWEVCQHLIHTLQTEGESGAAGLSRQVGALAEDARLLAYRLYLIADRKGWAEEALAYNGLVTSWPEIQRLAGGLEQAAMFGEEGE